MRRWRLQLSGIFDAHDPLVGGDRNRHHRQQRRLAVII
jgi:hypothetical protein